MATYFRTFALAGWVLLGVLSMGAQSCNSPAEYCRDAYTAQNDPLGYRRDRRECTEYCSATFPGRESVIKACQHGQFLFLSSGQSSAEQSVLDCERQAEEFAAKVRENVRDITNACKRGVTEEELRLSRVRTGAGQARDRETGN